MQAQSLPSSVLLASSSALPGLRFGAIARAAGDSQSQAVWRLMGAVGRQDLSVCESAKASTQRACDTESREDDRSGCDWPFATSNVVHVRFEGVQSIILLRLRARLGEGFTGLLPVGACMALVQNSIASIASMA